MNPRLMLLLWRERWGKTSDAAFKAPYLQGKLNLWGGRLAYASVWSLPGVNVFALLPCILLLALMLSVRFSLNSQIVFSVVLICIGVYGRRYAGTLVTLALIGLSFMVSARYLYWRFSTTLGQDLNSDFILGFGLCVAESCLWLRMALGWIQTIWPLKRAHVPMASEPAGWPTVDVFILCHGQPHAAIKRTTMATLMLDWPKKKIRIYILDDGHRDDIHALADSIGVTYLAHPDNCDGKAGNINRALPETKGELIAIYDCDQTPDKGFLQMTVGWFVRDMNLGMLQTPHHFLAPAPSECSLEIFHVPGSGASCALIRRSMLVEVGGVESGPVSEEAHTALKLQALGYGNAYIDFAGQEDTANENPTVSVERKIQSAPEIFRVDSPFSGKTLLWKLRLSSLQAMLKFYYALPRLIFFTAPLAYLLAGAHIIQTSTELFAAYALPHFIHGHIAQARMQGKGRFTIFADIRETVLAWYMLVPTTMTLIRTEFDKCKNAFKASKAEKDASFNWVVALPYVIILVLNLTGFISGITRLLLSSSNEREIAVLYLLWSAYNLMLLAGMLAVAEEARHLRRQARLTLQMPAMIQLPSGRAVSCMTKNFPEEILALMLPTPIAVETGLAVNISIFRGYREFTFPAQVVFYQDMDLRVNIEDTAQNDYRALGAAVLSRGQDWPKWLPDRDADRPFPPWMTKAIVAALIAALDFATNFGKHMRWVRLDNWIQIGKRRND